MPIDAIRLARLVGGDGVECDIRTGRDQATRKRVRNVRRRAEDVVAGHRHDAQGRAVTAAERRAVAAQRAVNDLARQLVQQHVVLRVHRRPDHLHHHVARHRNGHPLTVGVLELENFIAQQGREQQPRLHLLQLEMALGVRVQRRQALASGHRNCSLGKKVAWDSRGLPGRLAMGNCRRPGAGGGRTSDTRGRGASSVSDGCVVLGTPDRDPWRSPQDNHGAAGGGNQG